MIFYRVGIFWVNPIPIGYLKSSVSNSRDSWALLLMILVKLLTKRVFHLCLRNDFHKTSFFPLLTKRVLTKRVFWLLTKRVFTKRLFTAAYEKTAGETSLKLDRKSLHCSRTLINWILVPNSFTKRVFPSAHDTSTHETSFLVCSRK